MIEHYGRNIEVDARPSDAIALAVRTDVPIYVETHVLEQAGVFFDEDEQPAQEPLGDEAEIAEPTSSDDLSLFRDFINTLDLDNPEKGGPERTQ